MTHQERAEQAYADKFAKIHGIDYNDGKAAGNWPSKQPRRKSKRGDANRAAIIEAMKNGAQIILEMQAETGIHKSTISIALKLMVKSGAVKRSGMRKGPSDVRASRVYRLAGCKINKGAR